MNLIKEYGQRIGRIPLLTQEELLIYSKQVQQMISLLRSHDKANRNLQSKTVLQECVLHTQLSEDELSILQQGYHARKKMIEANLRLVVKLAQNYQGNNVELLDLIQEGTIGLIKAVEKFDPTRGYKFSPYAYCWIRKSIMLAINEKSRLIRVSVRVAVQLKAVKKTQQCLSQKLGRRPNSTEIAETLKMPIDKVQAILHLAQQSIEVPLQVVERLKADSLPEQQLINYYLSRDCQRILAKLTPKQQNVILYRFGFVDGECWTLAKIGDKLNISKERVRQIEQASLGKLRVQAEVQETLKIYY